MNKTLERLYLTLYWRKKAYGYPPSLADLATSCGVGQTMIVEQLKNLARQGYIKLYLYKDGDYNVEFLIEPNREWVVNIEINRAGQIKDIVSEIPLQVYVHDGTTPIPTVLHSRKTLDKAELIKKGIMI